MYLSVLLNAGKKARLPKWGVAQYVELVRGTLVTEEDIWPHPEPSSWLRDDWEEYQKPTEEWVNLYEDLRGGYICGPCIYSDEEAARADPHDKVVATVRVK